MMAIMSWPAVVNAWIMNTLLMPLCRELFGYAYSLLWKYHHRNDDLDVDNDSGADRQQNIKSKPEIASVHVGRGHVPKPAVQRAVLLTPLGFLWDSLARFLAMRCAVAIPSRA